MRKAYSSVLLFYLLLHFVFPIIYYYFFGFVNLYSEIENNIYVIKGVMLNLISVLGTILVINFLPNKKTLILPKFKFAYLYLILTFLIQGVSLIFSGGYESVLGGSLNGTFISYLMLFFDINVGVAMFLFFQENLKYSNFVIIMYIIMLTFSGSRSAIILIIIISLILPLFINGNIIKEKMRKLIIILIFSSPLLFVYATSIRGDIDKSIIYNIIIGRISMVELAAIPIESKDKGEMNKDVYNAKYGVINQIEQSINEISPINPFKQDVNPNQFHRSVFKGVNEETILTKYMSINLTLPTYIYLESNFLFSCFISIFFLSLLYYIWVRNSNSIFLFVGIILNLYYILMYFDWVLIVAGFYKMFLSTFALMLLNWLINSIKKNKTDNLDSNYDQV